MKTHLAESLETPMEKPLFVCTVDLNLRGNKEQIMSKGFDILQ